LGVGSQNTRYAGKSLTDRLEMVPIGADAERRR
jgi:hypothetical protein